MADTWTGTELRKKAEELVEAKHQDIASLAISEDQLKEIIHELQVHQVELEMQNDELRTTHLELQESRDKYDFLYNSAPVGYFTLDVRGVILQVNLTGANLLGKVKSLLIKMPFFVLVYPSDRGRFQQFLKRVLETGEKEACEIRLNRHADQIEVWLQGITEKTQPALSDTCSSLYLIELHSKKLNRRCSILKNGFGPCVKAQKISLSSKIFPAASSM